MKPIFIVIIILIIILLCCDMNKIKEGFECDNTSKADDQIAKMGDTAPEACSRISTKAEEISSHYKGASDIITSFLGPLSPKNWGSGNTKTDDIITNIINNNMSQCDILKIENDCKNLSSTSQKNVITSCPLCTQESLISHPDLWTKVCGQDISNVSQTNIADISQECSIHSAINTLLKKTSSLDSQALAQVVLEASGFLSGDNNYQSDNCTMLNFDMSSKQYLENRSQCSNEIAIEQENMIEGCSRLTDITQKNNYANLQSCLMQSSIATDSNFALEAVVKTDKDYTQSTTGIDLDWTICAIVCGIILGIVLIVALIYGSKTVTNPNTIELAKTIY